MRNQRADRRRVLVIEDDPGIRRLLELTIARRGWICESAADGSDGMKRLGAGPCDAILLDLMLPRVSGFDIVRHIKEQHPELLSRVIVMTAASNAVLSKFEDRSLVRKLIRKPFDLLELMTEVEACTGAARKRTEPA